MQPFDPLSISLRLYPHNELEDPALIIRELCDQASLALSGGFDGVMLSEHHGGFPGYLPLPSLFCAFILEEIESGWVAPCPLLLPLRPAAHIAEEIAWLGARHPGRIGLGVAAGGSPLDFEIMGVPFEEATQRFTSELPRIASLLRGERLEGLQQDPALRQLSSSPIPLVSAAMSRTASRRAAQAGLGILLEGISPPHQLAEYCDAYAGAGGDGPRIMIRRVWLGQPSYDVIERQRQVYSTMGGSLEGRSMPQDQTISSTDPVEIAERLIDAMTMSHCDSINIRIHLPGMTPDTLRSQIRGISEQVLPVLRSLLERVHTAPSSTATFVPVNRSLSPPQ